MIVAGDDIGPHAQVFLAQRITFRRIPVGTFPAINRAEHAAELLQAVINRRGLQRTGGGTLLIRIMHGEDVGIGFLVLGDEVTFRCVRPEAARIDTHQVERRLAVDDPFSQLPAGAAGSGDAEGMAFVQPEILQARCGTDNRVTVRRIGDSAIIDFLDAHFAEGRNTHHGGFDMRHQAVEFLLEQLIFAVVGGAVDITDRRADFVRTEDQTARFFAHIPGRVGFAQNAHFRQALAATFLNGRVRLGNDILMFDRNDRNVDADHLAGLAGKGARAGDDMFGDDLALIRRHLPVTVFQLLDGGDGGVAIDGRATITRALGQRLRQIGRLDITVIRMLDGAQQAVRLAERPDFLHLLRRQHVDPHTDGLGNAGIIHIFVPAILGAGETDVGDLGEADIHAGLFLKLLIELDGIFVDLADRIAHVEQRQKPGGMPGGTRGELLALDENAVAPALLGKMIKRRNADDAATDHHRPCMCLHLQNP
ncbi:hypothetical protein D3C72_800080 [compost metagenome]